MGKKYLDTKKGSLEQSILDLWQEAAKKSEAVSPAQQAAIAISKKEKGEKPKNEAQGSCWDGYEQKGMKKKGTKLVPASEESQLKSLKVPLFVLYCSPWTLGDSEHARQSIFVDT